MKTLHIHIKTKDLAQSVRFYSAMFGAAPTKQERDYAKWLLEDPRAHVSISTHGDAPGIDHAGVSVESEEELGEIASRLREAGAGLMAEEATTCCYAQSNKYWARDPQGAVWELFHTFSDSDAYGAEPDRAETRASQSSCCA